MEPLLEAVGLCKSFGGAVAVDGISFSIRPGELTALIGPNGAGKTTLFDLLAGDQSPSSGRVLLRGRAVERDPAHARLAAGLGRTFQIPRPFAAMTVVENVMLGCQDHVGERVWANWMYPRRVARREAAVFARAMELLQFVTLSALAHQPAAVLSGGQRKLLELARLGMADPSIVLLDEPAAGVAPALLDTIVERITALNDRGVTFLIVEHNMELIGRLCDRVLVMAAGQLLCEGSPQEVLRDERVREAYLGGVAA